MADLFSLRMKCGSNGVNNPNRAARRSRNQPAIREEQYKFVANRAMRRKSTNLQLLTGIRGGGKGFKSSGRPCSPPHLHLRISFGAGFQTSITEVAKNAPTN